MKEKCFICGWQKGYTHGHHIVPISEMGEDTDKNKIPLCPNHHSECHAIGTEKFNKKYCIPVGEKISEEKRKAMMTVISICTEHFPSIENNFKLIKLEDFEEQTCLYLKLKYKFAMEEAISLQMGVGLFGICRDLCLNVEKVKKEIETFKSNANETLTYLIENSENFKMMDQIHKEAIQQSSFESNHQ